MRLVVVVEEEGASILVRVWPREGGDLRAPLVRPNERIHLHGIENKIR
jgi:hypothetical protein